MKNSKTTLLSILAFGLCMVSSAYSYDTVYVDRVINNSDLKISLRRTNFDEADAVRRLRIPIEPGSTNVVNIALTKIATRTNPKGGFDRLLVQIEGTGEILRDYEPSGKNERVLIQINRNRSVDIFTTTVYHAKVVVEKVINLSNTNLTINRIDEKNVRPLTVPVRAHTTVAVEMPLERTGLKFDTVLIQNAATGNVIRSYQPSGETKRIAIEIEADGFVKILPVTMELTTMPPTQPQGILKKRVQIAEKQ